PYSPERHGPQRIVGPGFHNQVHTLVRAVPAGAVTTYGDVAAALGSKNVARQVGWALAALPDDSDVPWWRVVAAGGQLPRDGAAAARHRRALAADGVHCSAGRVADFASRRHTFGA
ncbi:MAG: MGMT family protein, partial [Planctomycetes bacterium]|nr:MGMT family protein [Planctomycetota bacterium]